MFLGSPQPQSTRGQGAVTLSPFTAGQASTASFILHSCSLFNIASHRDFVSLSTYTTCCHLLDVANHWDFNASVSTHKVSHHVSDMLQTTVISMPWVYTRECTATPTRCKPKISMLPVHTRTLNYLLDVTNHRNFNVLSTKKKRSCYLFRFNAVRKIFQSGRFIQL